MRIVLPHLPYHLDVKVYNCLIDFIFIPKHLVPFGLKSVNMEYLKNRKKNKPIDLSNIFGVVRTELVKSVF